MNDLQDNIRKLLQLKKDNKFIVNNKYECIIKNNKVFTIFTKDEKSPTYNSEAMIKVIGYDTLSKIVIQWNLDLTINLNCLLCFYENNKSLLSMITVTDLKIL